MKKWCILVMVSFMSTAIQAQINIKLANIEEWVKTSFVGQGVVIGNIKTNLSGKDAAGTFSNNGVLQLKNGLVMSTGDISTIATLNDKFNESTAFKPFGKPDLDKDLQKIIKGAFYDLSYIEFDFVPNNNSIQFNYQFGSEEYPEFVGSEFNDVFAFIVSDGDSSKNIALIPGKKTPVSINTVNFKTDSTYYIDNNVFSFVVSNREKPINAPEEEVYRSRIGKVLFGIKKFFTPKDSEEEIKRLGMQPNEALIKKVNDKLYRNLQFDGITTKLAAQTFVTPYKKYHLKIIIADVTDNVYDSGVFLEQGSLITKKDITQPGFVDYPDLNKEIDLKRILDGEKIQDILVQREKEINKSSQVKDPLSAEAKPNGAIIYFDFDDAKILESEMSKIQALAKTYETLGKGYKIELIGHTDIKGSLNYNLMLSEKRSKTVAECLRSISTSIKNIVTSNKAYLVPASDNETDQGRAMNRRVEIKFIKN
jgi:outer membrane protein OmpA-like peptidoglycan-associated protein